MAQFKAGEIKAEHVKATIDIQMKTIQALAATTPSGDRTTTLHETDVAQQSLKLAASQLWIATGEPSGLPTRTATTESVSLCVRMRN
jgi:hypothetical protein